MLVYFAIGIMLVGFVGFAYVLIKYSNDREIDMFRSILGSGEHPFLGPGTSQKEYQNFDLKHFSLIFYLSVLAIYATFIQAYFLLPLPVISVIFIVVNIFLYFIKKKKWTGLLKFFLIMTAANMSVLGMFITAKYFSGLDPLPRWLYYFINFLKG